MLSDISRLVYTSLVTVSQVAESYSYNRYHNHILLQFLSAGSLLAVLTGRCCNYSEVIKHHCGYHWTSHCVWGERSAPSELLSSTDTTSPHQAQARLVDTTNLPPPPPPSSVPSLNSQDAGFGLDKLQVTSPARWWCGLAMSCHGDNILRISAQFMRRSVTRSNSLR